MEYKEGKYFICRDGSFFAIDEISAVTLTEQPIFEGKYWRVILHNGSDFKINEEDASSLRRFIAHKI